MAGSIDQGAGHSVGPIGRTKVVWLIGTRVAETILASGVNRPHQQAGHMDASDPIRLKYLLCHGGRPHMGPCFRRDDDRARPRFHHGIANRSVLPPLDMSTGAKPSAARPRLPQSPCSLISNLLSRVQSCVRPPQFSGLSLYWMVRLSPSTASAKLKICLGWPLTSGCRHLPGSIWYQPRLVTALPSSVATAAMILCGVSLHQVSPVEDGDCTASIMAVKKFGDCTRSLESPRLLRNAASALCVFGPSTPSIGAAS